LVGFIGSTGSDSSWCMLKRRGVDTEFRLHVLLDLSSLLGVVHTRDRLVLCNRGRMLVLTSSDKWIQRQVHVLIEYEYLL